MGCRLWGRTESDTTEVTQQQQQQQQQQQGFSMNIIPAVVLLSFNRVSFFSSEDTDGLREVVINR